MWTHCAALLVDNDGTLVDSSGPINRAWARFIDRYEVDPQELRRVAHGRRDIDIVEHFLPPEQRAAGVTLVRDAELADLDGLVPVPGAVELTAALDGLPWAVVTSATAALADVRLAAAGLKRPNVIVTAEDVVRGKPDPEGYRLAASRLGIDPAWCVVVEDAPSGIAAARAAGCRNLAVTTTHRPAELTAADWVVADLRSVRVERHESGIALDLDPIYPTYEGTFYAS
jgi:sugar-phosphatase